MKLMIKTSLALAAWAVSVVAAAEGAMGSIIFTTSEVSPALQVPTLGLQSAVVLGGLFLVMALRMLRGNRRKLASFALLAAGVGSALIVASVDTLNANGPPLDDPPQLVEVLVTEDNLDTALSFNCAEGDGSTVFRNDTAMKIRVRSVSDDGCAEFFDRNDTIQAIEEGFIPDDLCRSPADDNGPTTLSPGEFCSIIDGELI